jgi:peptide/nickel transport system substrate-binding protein
MMQGLLKWFAGFLVFFSFCLLTSCGSPKYEAGRQNVFRYNEAADISSLDPAYARDQSVIWPVNQIFNGLVQMDDHLIIRPCIASSWEISDSGREYTFHLRPDVYFHPDPVFRSQKTRKVRADDFIFSFERIIDPATASSGSWIFDHVERNRGKPAFYSRDDYTLVIRLKNPYPPFLSMLAMPYAVVVPKEAVEWYAADFRRHPVGTGPFMFKYWKEGVKLVLVKNPLYFEKEGGTRLPYLDAVSVTFLSDKQSSFLEFIKGNLDFISGLDPLYKDEMLTREGVLKPKYQSRINMITQPYLNTEYLGFLVDAKNADGKQNPLNDKRIRQAINFAFDRKKMILFLRNNIGTPGIHGIIPRGLPGFDSSAVYYDFKPAISKQLLAEAGYPGGKGMPSVTLVSTPDYLDFCKHIQHQLNEIGIEMKIEVSSPAAVKEMKALARLPFFRASWIADYPDAENYLLMFLSRNFCPRGPNYTHFSDPSFDRLYELAMNEPDDSIRWGLYGKMEKIVMEESPVVILYYDQVLRFVSKRVKGLGSNPMNMLTLKKVSLNH